MSDKTKQYSWLPWALATAIVFAFLILMSNLSNVYFLDPWTRAKALVTTIAINEFGAGIQDASPYWNLRLIALVSLVSIFVVGPSLWIYAEIKNQTQSSGDVLKKGFTWYAGVILVLSSLHVVPNTVVKGIAFSNTWEKAEQGKNQDELRSDLLKLGYDALERFYLPQNLGGGAGSFQTFPAKNSGVRPIKLEDLDSFKAGGKNTYELAEVDSDSVITIYGIGYAQGANPDYANADGRQGKIQIALEVSPSQSFEFRNMNTR